MKRPKLTTRANRGSYSAWSTNSNKWTIPNGAIGGTRSGTGAVARVGAERTRVWVWGVRFGARADAEARGNGGAGTVEGTNKSNGRAWVVGATVANEGIWGAIRGDKRFKNDFVVLPRKKIWRLLVQLSDPI